MPILKSSDRYPSITEFINRGGRLVIGYVYELGISAIAPGTVWEGKEHYESIEMLLKEAEQEITKWLTENY